MSAFFHKLASWRPRFILRRQFEKVFGFVPSETGRIRKLEQEAATDRLNSLALDFDLLCQEEENIYYRTDPYDEGVDPLTVRRQILALRPRIEAKKREFWRAHELTRIFGFKVEADVGGYVDRHELDHRLLDMGLEPSWRRAQ